ncbi:PCRF domain-containing protein [Patescibacteria group bacterium]|nr:PCRF domain-containing protein [Patescibacteria group bacterium]MBU4057470.1 PCRF domain-containing protein [Patescibacteria group bacterium]MBU4115926.1 PCRF domain-containing protein [Patescibacteria group bacterium]
MTEQDKKKLNEEIEKIETEMFQADFWNDKQSAQDKIKRLGELKEQKEGVGKYDKGNAVVTIFSGAGGDDSEDFSRMLLEMYLKFSQKKGWGTKIINKNENDHGGYRNITFEIQGKNTYGTLKNESGVHRLVRISPFNANQKRHTSFSMVEVIPKIPKISDIDIKDKDLEISFSKSSGPGGQNVNKRETAVRITHIPTKISAHVDSERLQEQNKQKALEILAGKLYHFTEEERKKKEQGLSVNKTTENEWGSQIRSYVLHPYKLVKDHRTDVEVRDTESVLNGGIDKFIEAEKGI